MAAPTTASSTDHVCRDPDVCGGKPRVTGTRISVLDVYVWHELRGWSADEIVARFPQLTHGDVYAAMAYAWDHRAEVLANLERGEQMAELMRRRFPSKLPPTAGSADALSP